MAYVAPQVKVFQQFTQAPAAAVNPLRAMVIGPHFKVVDYEDGDGLLGQYDPDNDTAYDWPDRPAGGIVDETFTKVFVKDALLRYYQNTAGGADAIEAVLDRPNRIRANDVNFKANGDDFPLDDAFYSRAVQVGDIARLYANVDGTTHELWTRVTDILPDYAAAAVDATGVADSDNSAAVAGGNAAVSNTGTGGGSRSIASNAIGATTSSTYVGFADGYVTETYTIEITTASVSGVGALARVTSASGTDDDTDVPITATGQTIGSRGTTFNWGGSGEWNVGDKFVLICRSNYVVPDVTAGGSFDSDADITYIVTVTKGGASATAEVSVSTLNGSDISGPHVVTELSAVSIGTKGVTVTFNEAGGTLYLTKGEKWYITCTGRAEEGYKTLVLADNLPTALRASTTEYGGVNSSSSMTLVADLNLSLYVRKTIELTPERLPSPPDLNWEHGETQLTVNAGVTVYDDDFVDDDGDSIALTLDADSNGLWSKVYVTYRALLQTFASSINEISDIEDVEDQLGPITADNPLALGVWFALRNANGSTVLFMGVPTNDNDGYSEVLDKASQREDVYTIVPLTRDTTIQNTVAAHVEAMSAAERNRWRIAFFNGLSSASNPLVAEDALYPLGGTTAYDDTDLLATVTDDPDASGTQYTLVEWADNPAGGGFVDMEVRAGDLFRTNYQGDGFGGETYDEYVVDSVISNQQLRLLAGPAAAINVARKFSVHRSYTKTEEATAYGAKAGVFASRRIYYVWPDLIEDSAGTQIDGFYLCAAIAGLISGVVPQQGLTNVELTGFGSVTRTTAYFSQAQLDTMAEAGVWIVAQDAQTGLIYTRHELSTSTVDVNERELMVVKNVDSISRVHFTRLKPFIGKANVQPRLFVLLRRQLLETNDYLRSQGSTAALGGQLISAEIVELRAHTVNPDQVVIVMNITVPYPLNVIELTLVV